MTSIIVIVNYNNTAYYCNIIIIATITSKLYLTTHSPLVVCEHEARIFGSKLSFFSLFFFNSYHLHSSRDSGFPYYFTKLYFAFSLHFCHFPHREFFISLIIFDFEFSQNLTVHCPIDIHRHFLQRSNVQENVEKYQISRRKKIKISTIFLYLIFKIIYILSNHYKWLETCPNHVSNQFNQVLTTFLTSWTRS